MVFRRKYKGVYIKAEETSWQKTLMIFLIRAFILFLFILLFIPFIYAGCRALKDRDFGNITKEEFMADITKQHYEGTFYTEEEPVLPIIEKVVFKGNPVFIYYRFSDNESAKNFYETQVKNPPIPIMDGHQMDFLYASYYEYTDNESYGMYLLHQDIVFYGAGDFSQKDVIKKQLILMDFSNL